MHVLPRWSFFQLLLSASTIIAAHSWTSPGSHIQRNDLVYSRRLLQASRSEETISNVTNAKALATAISKAKDNFTGIRLTRHITVTSPIEIPETSGILSIWGECEGGSGKSEFRKGVESTACQITFDTGSKCEKPCALFTANEAASKGWMSNLVLIDGRADRSRPHRGIEWFGTELWLSDMSIHKFTDRGITAKNTKLYATDVLFKDNSVADAKGGGGLFVEWTSGVPSWAVLYRCTFEGNGNEASYWPAFVIEDKNEQEAGKVVLMNTTTSGACLSSTSISNPIVVVSNSPQPLEECEDPLARSAEIQYPAPTGLISGQSGGDMMHPSSEAWLKELCKVGVPGAEVLYENFFGIPYKGLRSGNETELIVTVDSNEALQKAVSDPSVRFIKLVADLELTVKRHDFDNGKDPSAVHFNYTRPESKSKPRMIAIWGDCQERDKLHEQLTPGNEPSETACIITTNFRDGTTFNEARLKNNRTSLFTTYSNVVGGRAPWQGWFSNLVFLHEGSVNCRAISWTGGNLFVDRVTFQGFRDRAIRSLNSGNFITNSLFIENRVKEVFDGNVTKNVISQAGGAVEVKLSNNQVDPAIALFFNSTFRANVGGVGGGAISIYYSKAESFSGDALLLKNTFEQNSGLESVNGTKCNSAVHFRSEVNRTELPRLFIQGDFEPVYCGVESETMVQNITVASVSAFLGRIPVAASDWLEELIEGNAPGADKVKVQLILDETTSPYRPPDDGSERVSTDSSMPLWGFMVIGILIVIFIPCCGGIWYMSKRRSALIRSSSFHADTNLSHYHSQQSQFHHGSDMDTTGSSQGHSDLTRYLRYGTIGTISSTTALVAPYLQGSTKAYITRAYGADHQVSTLRPLDTACSEFDNFQYEMTRLDKQLDSITRHGTFMGRYELLGSANRRRGGQGLVQFARDVHNDKDIAIKFYVSPESFAHEHNLYANPKIAAVCPDIYGGYDSATNSLRDPDGRPLISFIVFDRGEALDEWARRNTPDIVTGIQVVSHVAQCLMKLHDANIAHRDLKPGNTLWLPRKSRWTLIDVGCSAEIGTEAPTLFSPQYASPETVASYEDKQPTTKATAAVDAWALGIMAWELLTESRVFPITLSTQQVCDALVGRSQLPWEREDSEHEKLKLGHMSHTIMSLLNRDPSGRPTMQDVVTAIAVMFGAVDTRSVHRIT